MQLLLPQETVNTITKRLDQELAENLSAILDAHIEVELVPKHKLGTGIIFSVQTSSQRIEIMTACIPILSRSKTNFSISTSSVKYLCARYDRSPRNDQWLLDISFGDQGYQAFALPSFEDESVETLAGVMAEHVLHHLSPLFA